MAYWFWIFLWYSFFGCLLERGFAAATHAAHRTRRCMALLPLCPVYGLGMAAVLALPLPMRAGWWAVVAGGAVTTAVEFGYHWACQRLFGVAFWDYSGVPGNVQGRICLPFSLAWGVLTAVALIVIQPVLARLVAATPPALTYLAMLVFTADLVYSVQVLAVTGSLAVLRGQA